MPERAAGHDIGLVNVAPALSSFGFTRHVNERVANELASQYATRGVSQHDILGKLITDYWQARLYVNVPAERTRM